MACYPFSAEMPPTQLGEIHFDRADKRGYELNSAL